MKSEAYASSAVTDLVPVESKLLMDTYMIPKIITGARKHPLEAGLEDVQ